MKAYAYRIVMVEGVAYLKPLNNLTLQYTLRCISTSNCRSYKLPGYRFQIVFKSV